MTDLELLVLGTCTFLLAGAIKGLVGIGLPTASMGMLTLFVSPRLAIALILFPMLLSNLWQMWREGEIRQTVVRYRYFAIVLFVIVGLTAVVTRDAEDRFLMAVLGCVILLFVGFSWKGLMPVLPPKYDTASQISFGAIAGILGGLTSGWAAPLGIYLSMSGAGREDWIRATGFLIFTGSVPLTLAYLWTGHLTTELAKISALMLIPTFAGFAAGEALRNRLSVGTFRIMLLIMFGGLGLNLLRRAIWYG